MTQHRRRSEKTPKGTNGQRPRRPQDFKPGQNSHNGKVFRRGVDLVPRRQVQRGVLLKALSEEELRDIQSGKRVEGRAAKRRVAIIRGAMLEDMALGYRRLAYAIGHLSLTRKEAAEFKSALMIAGPLLKLGNHIAEHLDNKPAGQVQAPLFVFSGQDPNQAVPPDAGQAKLSQAEEGYEEVREEDVL